MTLSYEDQKKLDEFYLFCKQHQYHVVSYPDAADLDVTPLDNFNEFLFNNYGDWAHDSNYLLNTYQFEEEVIAWFSDLLHIDHDASWGYVTNGGTESNMYGCLLARECFPNGLLYCSRQTHYSVAKICNLLRIDTCFIDTLPNGEMDVEALMKAIIEHQDPHPIIFANIGTIMTGAVDDIRLIQKKMAALGYAREDYYIHSDAALSGMILPFCEDPQPFDFSAGADSVAISGHKVIGTKAPCGVVIAKRENVEIITQEIESIAANDRTISGSRNGHTPLQMWLGIKQYSRSEHKQRIQRCLENAQYIVDRLTAEGVPAWRNKNATTVVFPKPSPEIIRKWYLSTQGEISRLVVSGHHQYPEQLDAVIEDIIADFHAPKNTPSPLS